MLQQPGLTGKGYGQTANFGGVTATDTDPFYNGTLGSGTAGDFGQGQADPFIGTAMATNAGESLGYPNGSQAAGAQFAQMAFSIEKATVSASDPCIEG